MQRILAIVTLTWKAAFRFKLFWVVAALLLLSVVGLPLLIQDDGTARGFTQIILTYTLSVIATLLGLSTLWLACGTLARDIEECQIQVVAVKPIARWQIWLGKWLGLISINAVLLTLSGTSVYFLMQYRATRLPLQEQEVLRNEVLVARGSAKEKNLAADINQEAEQRLAERLQRTPVTKADLPEARRQILEQVKAEYQVVGPSFIRIWEIQLPHPERLRDRPLQLRVKFMTSDGSSDGTRAGLWQAGVPGKTPVWRSEVMSLAPETFHEFQIPPNLFDDQGLLTIQFLNPNDKALLFMLDDGMEVLYPMGGFGGNFARGIGIIFCWMVLLATIGLTASTFLSFPVAAFVSLGVLFITLSSGTMANAVAEGTVANYNAEKGTKGYTPVDAVIIPTFKAALKIIDLAKGFSPIDYLGTGRNITWAELGQAAAQIILLLGGFLALIGITIFTRRELATAQGNQ